MPALFCNQSSKPSKNAGCFRMCYELLEPSYQLRRGQKAGGCSFRPAALGVCGESSGASLCLCCTSNDSEGLFGHSSPGEECPANTRLYIGCSGERKLFWESRQRGQGSPQITHLEMAGVLGASPAPSSVLPTGERCANSITDIRVHGCV